MGKIYVGQTKLVINVDVKSDISGASAILKYCKPDGTTGSFSASITDASEGLISYEIASVNDLDQQGRYSMWAYVTYGDGKVAAGEPFDFLVLPEGC